MTLIAQVWTFLNGKKSYIAGTALFLVSLGSFLTTVGHCADMSLETQVCFQMLNTGWQQLADAFMGLGIIGVRHAIAKQAAPN